MTIEQEARNEATRRAWDGELSHTDRDGFRARIDASEAFERGYIAGASRPVTGEMVLDATWAQFMRMPSSNPSDYAHAVIKALEAHAHTNALLDAAEPQETTTPPAKSQLEAVTNAIEKVLDGQDALHCTRVWEAWGYGTMSEDDFSPVTNDAEAVNEIASAVLEALGPRPITDEMVEAARKGWQEAHGRTGPGTRMRAALEAAEEARR